MLVAEGIETQGSRSTCSCASVWSTARVTTSAGRVTTLRRLSAGHGRRLGTQLHPSSYRLQQ